MKQITAAVWVAVLIGGACSAAEPARPSPSPAAVPDDVLRAVGHEGGAVERQPLPAPERPARVRPDQLAAPEDAAARWERARTRYANLSKGLKAAMDAWRQSVAKTLAEVKRMAEEFEEPGPQQTNAVMRPNGDDGADAGAPNPRQAPLAAGCPMEPASRIGEAADERVQVAEEAQGEGSLRIQAKRLAIQAEQLAAELRALAIRLCERPGVAKGEEAPPDAPGAGNDAGGR